MGQEEDDPGAGVHVAGDVGGPVASCRDAFVVPEAAALFMEDPDGGYHLFRLGVGIADKEKGTGSLIRFKELCHGVPPLSLMV